MQNAKRKIISFWLTHIFLRRIAKRYPEYFMRWIKDLTDDVMARKIMELRYVGDNPMRFEAISYKLYLAPRRVFEKHMNFAGDIMKDLSSIDKNLSKACYYDSLRGTTADRKY